MSFFLLTLAPLNRRMDIQWNGNREEILSEA
jgi:hypothetical protein